jgi:glycerophosphoryl diester phosphodiesterase
MPHERLRALIDTVTPIKERVIVSTGQDWNLRRLHLEDPTLPYGLDPGHYLDHAIEGAAVFLPQKLGAYGYRDDHPLAIGRTEPTVDYLRQRFETLIVQAPAARELFLNYRLLLQMLDDGFDVVACLRERNIETNVWTLDYKGRESLQLLERLVAAGVRRVTTNTRKAWERAISG